MSELWVVCLRRPDGSYHIENLMAVDEQHAMDEASALWVDGDSDEVCVAARKQADLK